MSVRGAASRGMTLIEILMVLVVLGILVGLAIPNLRSALFRAEAAKVVADMNTVRLALFEYREDNGSLPRSGRWDNVPPDLLPYLGDQSFSRGDIRYRLVTNRNRGRVIFDVRYPKGSLIGAELKRFRRPGRESGSVLWRSNRTRFYLLNNNR